MTEESSLCLQRMGAGLATLLLAMALTACGGDGSGLTPPTAPPVGQNPEPEPNPEPDPDPDATEDGSVEGTVSAPGAAITAIARDQQNWGLRLLAAVADLFIPRATAALDGLVPVAAGTVELIRIDNAGEQEGDVLATATISATGNYSLTLPANTSFKGNLVLRVTLNETTQLRAVAAQQQTDIDPVSEFVLRQLVAAEVNLTNVPVNEVVRLRGQVDGFAVAAGASIASAIANLEGAAGALVDQEIAELKLPAMGGETFSTVVAGDYQLVGLELTLGQRSVAGVDNQEVWVGAQASARSLTLSANGAGQFNANLAGGTRFAGLANAPGGSGGELFIEEDIDEAETLAGRVNETGLLTIDTPYDEDILDDADLGSVVPANVVRLRTLGAEQVYGLVGTQSSSETLFGLTAQSALDITQPQGQRETLELLLAVRNTEGQPALADGYGILALEQVVTNGSCLETPYGRFVLERPEVLPSTFGPNDFEFSGEEGIVSVNCAAPEDDALPAVAQIVGLDQGRFEVRIEEEGEVEVAAAGFADAGGNLLLATSLEVDDANPIGFAGSRLTVGVPLCTDCVDLDGTRWTVVAGLGVKYDLGGARLEEVNSLAGTRLSFAAVDLPTGIPNAVLVDALIDRRIVRSVGSVVVETEYDDDQQPTVDTVYNQDGAQITVEIDNETLRGFLSRDGQVMILLGVEIDETSGTERAVRLLTLSRDPLSAT